MAKWRRHAVRSRRLERETARRAAATVLALIATSVPASGQTRWITGDGDWSVPGNWAPAAVPDGGVSVVVDRPDSVTVGHASGSHTIGTLTNRESLVLSGGALTIDGASTIDGTFTLSGGTLAGSGVVTVTGAAILQGSAIQSGNGALVAAGDLTISGNQQLVGHRGLTLLGGATWKDGVIKGGDIVNAAGSVVIDRASSGVMTLDDLGTRGTVFANQGTYRKESGSTTILRGFSSTGRIDVLGGSLMLGGLDDVTLSGVVDVRAGAVLTVRGIVEGPSGFGSKIIQSMDGAASRGTLVAERAVTFRGDSSFGGTLSVTGGDTVVNGSITARMLDLEGRIGGAGTMIGNERVVVASATQVRDTARLIARGAMEVTADLSLGAGHLEMRGGANWSGGRIRGGSIVNHAGSTFTDTTASGLVSPDDTGPRAAAFTNEGTYRKESGATIFTRRFENTGRLEVAGGSFAVGGLSGATLSGVVDVAAGAVLRVTGQDRSPFGTTPVVIANMDGSESRGRLEMTSDVSFVGRSRFGGTVSIRGATTLDGDVEAAALELGGLIRGRGDVTVTGDTVVTFASRIEAAGGLVAHGGFDARGRLELQTGALELNGGGTLREFANSGVLRAAGGTVTLEQGVARYGGRGGTLETSGAGTLVIGGAASSETVRLTHRGAGLEVGVKGVRVSKDFLNDHAGIGNDFDPRRGITGAGAISSVGAAQAVIIGGVAHDAPVVEMNFGLVRGGTSKTLAYAIANQGAANASTDLRGAIQTAYGISGISDDRLSGSGVKAQNFGPIAGGARSGDLAVTFAAGSGGDLSGQSVRILNNFADVPDQVIVFTGSTTKLAVGAASIPPSGGGSVDLGNFRLGSPPSTLRLDVTNKTTGADAERLGIGPIATSGNFVVSASAGALVAPGATRASGITIGVGAGVAGVNRGNASVQYVSNGQSFDPDFVDSASNVQDIALKATGFALANPGLGSSHLDFGTVVKGSAQTRFLTITNDLRAGVGSGFQEALDASFGARGGADPTLFTTSGRIERLAAGGVSSKAMSVTLDTSVVGSFSAGVAIRFASNGLGTSGLGVLELPPQDVALSAGVIEATIVNPASAAILNAQPITVAARRVGEDAAFANLAIRNTAAPIAETLSAGFGGTTGAALVNGAGIASLGAQTTDAVTMRVGIDTATAGLKSGTVRVDFSGDISTTLVAQTVDVTGSVYHRAEADTLAPARLDFGVVRTGDTSPIRQLAIGNAAPVAALNDVLVADASVRTRGFAVAVDPTLQRPGLLAGQTLASGFTAAMDTRGFGMRRGVATIAFETRNPEMAPEILGSRTVELVGQINEVAAPRFDKVAGDGTLERLKSGLRVDFGSIELGEMRLIELSLVNAIEFGDDLAARFDLSMLGSAFAASGFEPVTIAAGAAEDALVLGVTGEDVGHYNGTIIVDWSSVYPGLADLAGTAIRIDVSAIVIATAPPEGEVAEPATFALLALGVASLWRQRRAAVSR